MSKPDVRKEHAMPNDLQPDPKMDVVLAEIMGWQWIRHHDLDYKPPNGPLCRVLVTPDAACPKFFNYVKCDLTDPRQVALRAVYHGPRWSTSPAAAFAVLAWAEAQGADTILIFDQQIGKHQCGIRPRDHLAHVMRYGETKADAIARTVIEAFRVGKNNKDCRRNRKEA